MANEYDYDPRNLPEAYVLAVGKVSVAWSQTENALETVIATLSGVGLPLGWALTTHMNFPMKCDAALSVAGRTLSAEDHEALRLTIATLKIASEARNKYVHGHWAISETPGEIFILSVRSRGTLKATYLRVGVEEIERAAADIYDVGMSLIRFLLIRGLAPKMGG